MAGLWDANSDRDHADDLGGPYGEPDDRRHVCRRCGVSFTKPADYPEWTTRVCDPCREAIASIIHRPHERGVA